MEEFHFLDFYQTPFVNNASNGCVIGAHRLEYRYSGRLTLTVTVCAENPIDNVK